MDNFQAQFDEAIQNYAIKNQYGVSLIPYHTHNGTDSPVIASSATTSVNGRSGGSGVTTIVTSTLTKVTLNTNDFANGITWDSTNHRFVVLTAGQYQINAQVTYFNNIAGGGIYIGYIYINGVAHTAFEFVGDGGTGWNESAGMSDIADLSVNDYIELYAFQTSGSNAGIYNDTSITFLSLAKI